MYGKIQHLLDENGITAYKMCKDTGISRSLMSQWKSGSFNPKQDKLQVIADYFGVPISYFYDDEPIYEVSAGHGRLNESYEVDDAVKADREYSKVRICGNSMHPVLHDGDLVRVRHTKEVSPSDLTIIQINGDEAMCKYVELKEDGIWLRAENKAVYEDKFYNAMEVLTLPITIIGVAEELVSRKL